jgi:hypothetical protein
MRTPNTGRCLGLLAVLAFGTVAAPAAPPGDEKVEIKVVKFAGLDDTVKQFQGKIIVMDFWADT